MKKITAQQIIKIYKLAVLNNISDDEINQIAQVRSGNPVKTMSRWEASRLIEYLLDIRNPYITKQYGGGVEHEL